MEIKAELIELTENQKAERELWASEAILDGFERVKNMRRQEYQRDADPLYFGWKRGENTEQDWLDAIQAVKDANPYPSIES